MSGWWGVAWGCFGTVVLRVESQAIGKGCKRTYGSRLLTFSHVLTPGDSRVPTVTQPVHNARFFSKRTVAQGRWTAAAGTGTGIVQRTARRKGDL